MSLQKNAIEYLIHTAELYPDKTAFDDGVVSLTFGELYESSVRAGNAVYEKVGSIRKIAAVLIDRTTLSLVGCFAALAAGLCYVPVDDKMPLERMEDILAQINPPIILYSSRSSKQAKTAAHLSGKYATLSIEDALGHEADYSLIDHTLNTVLDIDPAYMIFTSGSTGKPKGILISHRSLIDFTEWMNEESGVTSSDTLGNQAPFYFDLSVKDIYQTLKTGCTTYILPKKLFMFPTLLVDYLNSHNVNSLIWATSAFRLTAESGVFEKKSLPGLKRVILGGEALQAKHLNIWKKAAPECQFTNLYGPTEVTVDCTSYRIERDFADGEPIPIGKACRNMEVILLDDELKPVPDGEPGEICVRGIGLAIGYYGDFAKTDAAFIQNPLNPDYPDRLYRTGDIAKRDSDGNLLFLSRRDNQIKHMGYRIELGEVETALSGIREVVDGVCFFDEKNDLIVCCLKTTLNEAELTTRMKELLPKYMLPNVWRILPALPMNANGKVDRVQLKKNYFDEEHI